MVTRVKGITAPNAAEIDMEDGRTVQAAMPVIGNGPALVPDGAVLNTRLGTGGNLGSAATADLSTSVSSTSLITVPTSSALKETYDKAVQVQTTRLGWNQTWQNMTASRAAGVTYTNTTGRPIVANVNYGGKTSNSRTSIVATVDGAVINIGTNSSSTAGVGATGHVIIPSGSTYSFNAADTWWELR